MSHEGVPCWNSWWDPQYHRDLSSLCCAHVDAVEHEETHGTTRAGALAAVQVIRVILQMTHVLL